MISDEILVVKEVHYKENDKILHALSRNRGKIQLIARGAKKSNSHLLNASQIFAHSRCSLVKSRDMYILTSAELIDNFYNLKNNIDAFFRGNYVLELIAYVAEENQVDKQVFDMTISVLHYLTRLTKDFDKLIAAYELKLVSMLGYKPDFSHCIKCGKTIKGDSKFSIKDGGLICTDCVNYGNGINVNYREILTMNKILRSRFEEVKLIEMNPKILQLIRNFLFYYIGKDNFSTLKLF